MTTSEMLAGYTESGPGPAQDGGTGPAGGARGAGGTGPAGGDGVTRQPTAARDTPGGESMLDEVERAIGDIAAGRRWWSWTTRTGRTRATSSSRPAR